MSKKTKTPFKHPSSAKLGAMDVSGKGKGSTKLPTFWHNSATSREQGEAHLQRNMDKANDKRQTEK